jgi:hypothetical protein
MNKFKLKKTALITTIILSSGLLIFIKQAGAEMYKWVDQEGITHYTQSPPPGDIEAKTLKPPPKIDTESARARIEQQQEKAKKLREGRLEEAKIEAEEKKAKAIEEENCKRAHQRMATFSRPRGLIQQEDGSRIRVDEEARQAGIRESQKMIEEYCK